MSENTPFTPENTSPAQQQQEDGRGEESVKTTAATPAADRAS